MGRPIKNKVCEHVVVVCARFASKLVIIAKSSCIIYEPVKGHGERIRQHRKTARGTCNAFAELIWAWDMSLSHCQVTLATAAQLIALIALKKESQSQHMWLTAGMIIQWSLCWPKWKLPFSEQLLNWDWSSIINIVINSSNTSNTSMPCSRTFMVINFTGCHVI